MICIIFDESEIFIQEFTSIFLVFLRTSLCTFPYLSLHVRISIIYNFLNIQKHFAVWSLFLENFPGPLLYSDFFFRHLASITSISESITSIVSFSSILDLHPNIIPTIFVRYYGNYIFRFKNLHLIGSWVHSILILVFRITEMSIFCNLSNHNQFWLVLLC